MNRTLEQRLSFLEKRVGLEEESSETPKDIQLKLQNIYRDKFPESALSFCNNMGWDYQEIYGVFGVSNNPRFVKDEDLDEIFEENPKAKVYGFSFWGKDDSPKDSDYASNKVIPCEAFLNIRKETRCTFKRLKSSEDQYDDSFAFYYNFS